MFFHELLTWLHLEKHKINRVIEKGISIVYLGNGEKPSAARVESSHNRELDSCHIVENLKYQDEDFLLYLLDNGEPFNGHTLE